MRPDVYLRESARTECDQLAAFNRLGAYQSHPLDVHPANMSALHGLIGCMNELGELTTLVQKWIWYGKPFTEEELRAKVKDEAGDLLWHFSQVLRRFGLTFEELMEGNIAKLKARYPDAGWCALRAAEENRDRKNEALAQAYGKDYNTEPGVMSPQQYADLTLNEPLANPEGAD
jgi:NTP pyrophosphatase (non-canonical NTP hydrolase)